MNYMGGDLIRTVNLIKSARIGYIRMLLGVEAHFIERKSRNNLPFQPTDSAAEDFMKSRVEPMIRDVPALLELVPWSGRKHRDDTFTLKRFSPSMRFWCLGGATVRNYHRKSVDVVCYDELSSFRPDVEKEGSPTLLGDKRIEGPIWPKSTRGPAPKIKDSRRIEKVADESAHSMRFYVPCPHCGEEQYLKFGDNVSPSDLKWEKNRPESVSYLCEHRGCAIHQSELDWSDGWWACENTDMWTRDGLMFFNARGDEIPPSHPTTFHIWMAHSPFATWVQTIYDWLDVLKDPNNLKIFVNATLGETWKEVMGEKLDRQVLMDRVVRYTAAMPVRMVYLTAGINPQRNRFGVHVWGQTPGEEAFLVDKTIIMGRPDEEETLLRMDAAINKKYRRADRTEVTIPRIYWDIGGTDDEIVYQRSKKHDVLQVLPIKGASVCGKPAITMPRTHDQRGVYLCEVGTGTAKEILYVHTKADPTLVDKVTSYIIRFPDDPETFSQTEAQQLTAEEPVEKQGKGKMRLLQDDKERYNEALDCLVYAYAVLYVPMQRWQPDLAAPTKSREKEMTRSTLKGLTAELSGGVNDYNC